MKSPSIDKLTELGISRDDARLIKRLCAARDNRDALQKLIESRCPTTEAYARRCYIWPYASSMWRTTLVLHACDALLGTHGVEPLYKPGEREGLDPPSYEYCNNGDTYSATLIYVRAIDTLRVGSWGDIAERLNS